MASSFSSQIPAIVYLLSKLQPKTVLDVGKGFGKYGFLIHEYVGVDHTKRPDPNLTLAAQSRVAVDAVECNADYLWPHLSQFYRKVFAGRIEDLYKDMAQYDVVLMADVIEHLQKSDGLDILKHFVAAGSSVILSTPIEFFDQALYESEDEHHRSHWSGKDFSWCHHDSQNVDGGAVFVLSASPLAIRGFGSSPQAKLRRVARTIRDCM